MAAISFSPETLVPIIPEGDSELEKSVEPKIDIIGQWLIDKSRSDDMKPAMRLKGVGWALRKALGLMSYTLAFRKNENGNVEVRVESAIVNTPWTECPVDTEITPNDTPGMRNQKMKAVYDEDGNCLHQRYEFIGAHGKSGVEHRRMRIKQLDSGEILMTNSLQLIMDGEEIHKVVVYVKKR